MWSNLAGKKIAKSKGLRPNFQFALKADIHDNNLVSVFTISFIMLAFFSSILINFER